VNAFGDEVRSYVYVHDVVALIHAIVSEVTSEGTASEAATRRQRLWCVGGPIPLTRVDVARAVAAALAAQVRVTLPSESDVPAVAVGAVSSIPRADAKMAYDAPLNAAMVRVGASTCEPLLHSSQCQWFNRHSSFPHVYRTVGVRPRS
jgi:hypothetical protein